MVRDKSLITAVIRTMSGSERHSMTVVNAQGNQIKVFNTAGCFPLV